MGSKGVMALYWRISETEQSSDMMIVLERMLSWMAPGCGAEEGLLQLLLLGLQHPLVRGHAPVGIAIEWLHSGEVREPRRADLVRGTRLLVLALRIGHVENYCNGGLVAW